ncbi:Hydrogenase assembly chaperone hypC/hupF [Bathymodiolus thermophilus thioautotrophic gill symbiont]|uniref:Hydrogenase assembly chaperone hypC/hupF n=1 Tax=Bathymodiolus thermophilus thioautotrophic gill symbiont TaxID=2360 RepID=A0A3G3IQ08_9GAMM|nr:HypC/HybG/HupF family hydrogenase formation chaperone [Bathymodiolus thermophilus thioautotrophic gill symbiont]AYQ57674.1 Hydrogenase assembly chaperone hypC/hupF [Bathymodiolus thermophilus thioautotrophic gill symbiont]
MCLGVPAQIKEIVDMDNQMAMVDLSGVSRAVNIACVLSDTNSAETLIGQWVLVHVGFALSVVDEEEAYKTLKILDEIGELYATMEDLKQGEK